MDIFTESWLSCTGITASVGNIIFLPPPESSRLSVLQSSVFTRKASETCRIVEILPPGRYLPRKLILCYYNLLSSVARVTGAVNPDYPDCRPISVLHSAVTLIKTNRRITLILTSHCWPISVELSLSMVLNLARRPRQAAWRSTALSRASQHHDGVCNKLLLCSLVSSSSTCMKAAV